MDRSFRTNIAIQIKHKAAAGNISPSGICGSGGAVCGADYLDQMVEQASNLIPPRPAMLVTNRQIGPALQELLEDRGILWVQVID